MLLPMLATHHIIQRHHRVTVLEVDTVLNHLDRSHGAAMPIGVKVKKHS